MVDFSKKNEKTAIAGNSVIHIYDSGRIPWGSGRNKQCKKMCYYLLAVIYADHEWHPAVFVKIDDPDLEIGVVCGVDDPDLDTFFIAFVDNTKLKSADLFLHHIHQGHLHPGKILRIVHPDHCPLKTFNCISRAAEERPFKADYFAVTGGNRQSPFQAADISSFN